MRILKHIKPQNKDFILLRMLLYLKFLPNKNSPNDRNQTREFSIFSPK